MIKIALFLDNSDCLQYFLLIQKYVFQNLEQMDTYKQQIRARHYNSKIFNKDLHAKLIKYRYHI